MTLNTKINVKNVELLPSLEDGLYYIEKLSWDGKSHDKLLLISISGHSHFTLIYDDGSYTAYSRNEIDRYITDVVKILKLKKGDEITLSITTEI